jgi:hypothetical protein
VAAVLAGDVVCAVSYGHPGMFADPFHDAVRRVRALGLRAVMHPAVSALDCLIADLGIDPGDRGCQSYESTDFVLYRRVIDVRSQLILWQIGAVGECCFQPNSGLWSRRGLEALIDVLLEYYHPDHEAVVYEASRHPMFASRIQHVAISRLADADITAASTLYVPPSPSANSHEPDELMLKRLRLRRVPPAAAPS